MKRYVDQRAHERIAHVARGYLVDKDANVTGCSVVDVSFSGARIKIPYGTIIPEEVTLCIPSKAIDRPIDIIWRAGDELGVAFSMSGLGLEEVQHAPTRAPSKPITVDQLRKMAEGAVSKEPVRSRINVTRLRETAMTSVKMDVWRDVGGKIKIAVEKRVCAIVESGRAMAVDIGSRNGIFTSDPAPAADPTPLPSSTEIRSQQDDTVDPLLDPRDGHAASDREVLPNCDEEMTEAEQDFSLSYAADAHQRLLNRKRWNLPLYAFVASLVFVGMNAAFFFMSSGGSVGAPVDQHVDIAAPAEISTADTSAVSSGERGTPVSAAVGSETHATTQMIDARSPQPVDGADAIAASAALPSTPSPTQGDDPVQPSQNAEHMAVLGGGKPAEPVAVWLQDAPMAPCSDAAHFVEIQTFQATMPAGLCTTMRQQPSTDSAP